MNSDIGRIVGKIGPSDEAFYYMEFYRKTEPGHFAVIKISGECIEKSLEQIAEDLSDLQQIELIPVITHGWGSTLTRILESLGIDKKEINGDRYTDKRVMAQVRAVAPWIATKLAEAIDSKGGKPEILDHRSKVVIGKDKEDKGYGEHNGDVVRINTHPIMRAIASGHIPIVSPIGISEDEDKLYNLNAAVVGAELAKAIDPVKYIMATDSGGVLDKDFKIISEIVLRTDYERLVKNGIISGGMLKNVDEARQSLYWRANGDDRSVQIVGADNLLVELFTRKGAGTYVRKGYVILQTPLESFNHQIVRDLAYSRFGEELKESYFDEKPKVVFHEQKPKGFGVVLPNPGGFGPYLDLLVVDNGYARNGLGTDLVTEIGQRSSWRSRKSREITDWYLKVSDGHQEFTGTDGHRYNYFWRGLTLDQVREGLQFAQQRPKNFK